MVRKWKNQTIGSVLMEKESKRRMIDMKEYIVQATAEETIDSFDDHNAPELNWCKGCNRAEHRGIYVGLDEQKPECFCAEEERPVK